MDNSIGYTESNCVLCCCGFNLMKTTLSLAEIEALARAFVSRVDSGRVVVLGHARAMEEVLAMEVSNG